MVFLLSNAGSVRLAVQKEVRSICDSAGLAIYGSFANGTFHLDSEVWTTFSDLDLTSSDTESASLAEQIAAEVERRVGLLIKAKIRKNISHIDRLPPSVSRQLSFIDTAIVLIRGIETRSLYHYLIVKYLLRTIYLERYLRYDASATAYGDDDVLFQLLMHYKMSGTNLTAQELQDITFRLKVAYATQFTRLLTLLSLREIDDLAPYWFSFSTGATRFGLNDLVEDISQKLELAKRTERTFSGYSLEDEMSHVGAMWPLPLRSTGPARKAAQAG